MGRGQLVFKGEDPKKKKKKSKHSKKKDNSSASRAAEETQEAALAVASAPLATTSSSTVAAARSQGAAAAASTPKINKGSGEITTSGTVVTGLDTKFEKEISPGDAVIVNINGQQEMRVVTMCLSNISLNLSSSFSKSLKDPTSYSIIRKPRDEVKQRKLHKQKEELDQKQEEQKASGTYGSTEELVYRERTEHGNYRIVRKKVEAQGISRADLLEMRSKKTSDKYC